MRKKHAYLAIALLLLIFAGCRKGDVVQSKPEQEKVKKPETQSVIGGTPTSINFKPYQVAIFINGDFRGGGIIINSEWILTAAHVVTVPNSSSPAVAFPLNQITVKSGSTYLNSGGTTSAVNDVIIHGGFPFNDGFTPQPDDIALVRLSTPLFFNSNQAAINYAISEDPLTVGDLVSVSGWGMTSCTATAASNSLNAVDIEVDDLTNPANIGCKPPTGVLQTAWKGDSGGPLVKNITGFGEVAVGVVNSVACGLGVGNYARVSHYAGWIYGHTGISRFSIQGTSSFCGSATYSIGNLPVGASVNWSVDNPTKITLANNGDGTVTLYSGAHTNNQNTILTAIISVGVNTYSATKSISFNGSPVLDDIFCYFPLNPTNYYTDSYYIFRLTYTGTAPSQVQWSYRLAGTTTETIVNSSNIDGAFSFFSPGTYDIIARPLDPCSMISGYYEEKTIVVEPF